jgi:hypothetical protein
MPSLQVECRSSGASDIILRSLVLGKVLAQVNVPQLPANVLDWVAQRPTQHLGAGFLGKLGDRFGVGGVQGFRIYRLSISFPSLWSGIRPMR